MTCFSVRIQSKVNKEEGRGNHGVCRRGQGRPSQGQIEDAPTLQQQARKLPHLSSQRVRNFEEVLGGGEGGEQTSVVITSNGFLSRQSVVGEIMTK